MTRLLTKDEYGDDHPYKFRRGSGSEALNCDRGTLMEYLRRRNREDRQLRPDRRDGRVRRSA